MNRITVCLFLALFVGVAHEILGSPLAREDRLARRPDLDIINGKNASIKDYPYVGSLYYDGYGGEVIGPVIVLNKRWVLTTALGVAGLPASAFQIKVGTNDYNEGGQVYQVASFKVPDAYELDGYDWSVAVLKTTKPIKFSNKVKSIKFATKSLKVGSKGKIAGWGDISHDNYGTYPILKETTQIVSDRTACRQEYGDQLTDRLFCALHNVTGPSAGGDEGDPLVVDGLLNGVYAGSDYMFIGDVPVMYVDIANPEIRKWIKNAIKS